MGITDAAMWTQPELGRSRCQRAGLLFDSTARNGPGCARVGFRTCTMVTTNRASAPTATHRSGMSYSTLRELKRRGWRPLLAMEREEHR